ncbi:MAG: class I SAM-dependent methyltransferase [Nitriliruptoraceae bacterium]
MSAHPTPLPDEAPRDLVLTGERTLPGIADERYWFLRHVVAYRLAQARIRATHAERDAAHAGPDAAHAGRDAPRTEHGPARSAGPTTSLDPAPLLALDAGCGEGYGLALLRDAGADRVLGVDLDAATVAHARQRYGGPGTGIEVVVAELREIPLPDDAADVTVSFQVIEHLHDIPGYLVELQRVTAAGGEVLLATPNRLTFTPDADTPVNPFHTVEFTAAELTRLLTRAGFEVAEVLGLHHAGALAAAEREHGVVLPRLLGAAPPEDWPVWARTLAHRTGEDDFTWRSDHLDASLDLLVRCRVRP